MMKRNLSKVLPYVILTIVLLIPLSSAETASRTTSVSANTNTKTLKDLTKKYGLKDAKVIPEGISPLEFNSIEEADKYLAASQKEAESLLNFSSLNKEDNRKQERGSQSVAPNAFIAQTVTKSTSTDSNVNLNVTATYLINGIRINSLHSVTSCITGNTNNMSWKQNTYTEQRLDSNRIVGVTLKGTLTKYIVVNGIKKLAPYSKTAYIEFNASSK